MLWVIYSISKPNSEIAELKAKHQEAHRAYLKSRDAMLFSAGPMLGDDGKEYVGGLWILNANSRAEATAFSNGEPYTKAGIFSSVTITRVRQGHIHPELAN